MRHIPNIITALRILGAVCVLFCSPSSVACCAIKLIPVLQVPAWLWIWAGVIVMIKLTNQISALGVCKRFSFPHTGANKLTGLLLFLTVPLTFWSVIPIAVVAGAATFAAIQEGHLIRTRKGELSQIGLH